MAVSNKEKDITNVLRELHSTITLIGIKETIKALKNGRDVSIDEHTDIMQESLKAMLISHFGFNECLESKNNDNNKAARGLFAFLLKRNGVNNRKIAFALKIHIRSVSHLINYVKTANMDNPKVPSEKILKEAYDKINQQLNTNKK
jgi:hypothetical protein